MTQATSFSTLLSTLILDIKIYIAVQHPKAYYHLYRYDKEFAEYAKTQSAIKQYIIQFNKPIISDFGNTIYYLFKRAHREDDLPAVIYYDGTGSYWYNGMIHRDLDLPAITYSNKVEYYKYGKLHREDDANGNPQPAIIWNNGLGYYYYKNGNQFHPPDQSNLNHLTYPL